MSTQLGKDLMLYAFGSLDPIGCEDSCTLQIINEPINTTTKGSGKWTNREYGRRDWTLSSSGVVGYSITGRENPDRFSNQIIEGKKVLIKCTVADGYFFGIGIVSAAEYTGAAEGFATYNITILADGPLYQSGITSAEADPGLIIYSSSTYSITYSDPLLLSKTLAFVLVDDVFIDPDDYTFNPNNGSGSGVITFDSALSSGKTVKLIYF